MRRSGVLDRGCRRARTPIESLVVNPVSKQTTEGAPSHLFDSSLDALNAWFESQKLPAYRARQVVEWVYQHGATSFEQMTNLPARLRAELAGQFVLYASTIASEQRSSDGTTKLLLRWPDGGTSECVRIPEADRNTACISSQAGCPVQCTFCASGIGGLERQLTAGQIVEQAMRIRALCTVRPSGESAENGEPSADFADYADPRDAGDAAPEVASAEARPSRPPAIGAGGGSREGRLTNIVFMGIGEPLANYKAVLAALQTIHAPWGMNLGARRITISTIGLPKMMRRLADEGLQINLAISLHAPTDELRRRLIPWTQRVTIRELIDAARYYFDRTGREVTLEYVMLAGVNIRSVDARRLARVTEQMRCNVNLIPYNPVAGQGYECPSDAAMKAFLRELRDQGVNAHIRRSRGLDIAAACGQLRRMVREAGEAAGGGLGASDRGSVGVVAGPRTPPSE